MTRENKLALVVGFGLILFIGILISDHFSVARNQTSANLTSQQIADPLVARTRNEPDLIALKPAPPPVNPPMLQGGEPAVNPSQMAAGGHQQPIESMSPEQRSGIARDVNLAQGDERHATPRDVQPVNTLAPKSGGAEITEPKSHDNQTSPIPGFVVVNADGTPIKNKDLKFHDVQGGESLFAICKQYYGDTALVEALAKFNKMDDPGALRVGRRLVIPPPEAIGGKAKTPPAPPASADPPSLTALRHTAVALNDSAKSDDQAKSNSTAPTKATTPAAPKTYTVKAGDSLSGIAQRMLGDREKWRDLVKYNKKLLDDPDDLKVGMVLKLG